MSRDKERLEKEGPITKLSQKAEAVVAFARGNAKETGFPFTGSLHLLFGVYEAENIAEFLRRYDIQREYVEQCIQQSGIGIIINGCVEDAPLDPWAQSIIEIAGFEARILNHKEITPEHIMVGLLRGEGGIAVRTIKDRISQDKFSELMMEAITLHKRKRVHA